MALDARKNFAKATVSTGYSDTDTSIDVASGQGGKFPAAPFNAIWWNATDYPDLDEDPNVEVVRFTAIASDTLTITRAQEGSSATTKNAAGKTYKLLNALTAKMIDDIAALGGAAAPLVLSSLVATDIPLVVQGASSQTAALQEWRDSTGAVVLSVNPDGTISGANPVWGTGYMWVGGNDWYFHPAGGGGFEYIGSWGALMPAFSGGTALGNAITATGNSWAYLSLAPITPFTPVAGNAVVAVEDLGGGSLVIAFYSPDGLSPIKVGGIMATGPIVGYTTPAKEVSATSYTLLLGDSGKVLVFTNSSPITVALPNNLPAGFNVNLLQDDGAGVVTVVPDSGATLRNRSSHSGTAGENGLIGLWVRDNADAASAIYILTGDTA